jgi:hypothetical protein
MIKKPVRPKHAIRTRTPQYFFGAAKAAVSNPHTRKRKPAKLPTSVDELRALQKKAT